VPAFGKRKIELGHPVIRSYDKLESIKVTYKWIEQGEFKRHGC